MDEDAQYLANTCYFIPSDSYALLGVLNSSPINWFYQFTTSEYRGGFQRSFTHAIRNLPIPSVVSEITTHEEQQNIASLAKEATDLRASHHALNLNLLDYLGNYTDGPSLPDIGLFQPTNADILNATAEDYDNLRVGKVHTERNKASVTVLVTARYKPEDEDAYKTDTYGYTETECFEAFSLVDCSENEAALVEAFVPVAVEEGGGFAGFRENATKTNSLIDRLKAITLPDPDDVADDLERYVETKARADKLDKKIEKTDKLIDKIVYDFYDLTNEEIEIIEEAVEDD